MVLKDAIISLPHPHLRKRSRKVGVIDDQILKLIADMESATLDWEDNREHEVGVALAAVQINKMLRLVVIRSNVDDKNDRTFMALINPEITKYEGQLVTDYEGCLSVANVYGLIERHSKVRVRALNSKGKEIRLTAEDFLARVLQHEIDHTNGIVFIDHIKDKPDAFYHLSAEGKLIPADYKTDIKDNFSLWS